MKITKFVHSCLLIETPERVALFDPGMMSAEALDLSGIDRLDDIFITHVHPDHMDVESVRQAILKFPSAKITTTSEAKAALAKAGITASDQAPEGVKFFNSPHERIHNPKQAPEQIGIHFLGLFSDPGDSHSFKESKEILALPMTAPWGSNVRALDIVLSLKPKHVLPVHDWHWHDQARLNTYDMFEQRLVEEGIVFHKLATGIAVEIE